MGSPSSAASWWGLTDRAPHGRSREERGEAGGWLALSPQGPGCLWLWGSRLDSPHGRPTPPSPPSGPRTGQQGPSGQSSWLS